MNSNREAACNRNRRGSRRILGGLALGLALWLLPVFPAWARQENSRRITVALIDRSGAAVPRAIVGIRTPEGRTCASAQTDARGMTAVSLPDGDYVLDATAPGFAPLLGRPLRVGADTSVVTLTLDIPSIREEIVVTATRTETPLAQVGSSVSVITGGELARTGADTVAEALRRVAGLAVAQNGPPGQLASLFTRGGESDYTKVLIDGIPVNQPGGSYNFSGLSAAGLDRIEIVRGPQSALFGSDAMAGVIQIFTRRGTSDGLEPLPFLSVSGGRFATFGYEAGVQGKNERLDYAASFARLDTDNDMRNGSYNNTTITGNLGIRPSPKIELRAVFRSDAGRAGTPGQRAFYPADSDAYFRHRNLAGGITFSYSTGSSLTQILSYTVSDSRLFSEDSVDTGTFVPSYQGRTSPFTLYDSPYQTLTRSRRQNLDYRFDLYLNGSHLLTAGAGFEHESGTAGDPASNPRAAVRDNFAGFVQDQWMIGKRLFGAAGVRIEHNENFGLYAAPRLSLAWHVHTPSTGSPFGLTKLKANFGLGIKEPTLVESFSKSMYFLGNPDLKAEESRSFDVGIEQHFGAAGGVLEATFFANRYRNQIGFIYTDFTTFAGTFANVGKSRARGLEVGFSQPLNLGMEIAGAYTFLDSRVLENEAPSDPVYEAGRPLLRRPRHSGRLDLRWNPGRWTLGASATVVGRRPDSDFLGLQLDRNPAYGTLDLTAGYRLFSGATAFAGVYNVLDRSYMETLGYPALPLHFRIGLALAYK